MTLTVDLFADYSDTHCYGCGERFERPLGSLTEEELETANSEHAVCFGEEVAR